MKRVDLVKKSWSEPDALPTRFKHKTAPQLIQNTRKREISLKKTIIGRFIRHYTFSSGVPLEIKESA